MSDQKIRQANNKIPLNLLPLRALKGVARVFGYGAKKYAKGNWYTADDPQEIWDRYVGGGLRHLAAAQNMDATFDLKSVATLDEESGLPEIDHMICGLIMLRGLAVKHGALPEDPGIGNDPKSTDQILADARVANGAFDVMSIPPYVLKVGDRVRVNNPLAVYNGCYGWIIHLTPGPHPFVVKIDCEGCMPYKETDLEKIP